MKLSACVIVKNEEKNLPQWLAYANAAADEKIVVDTGSTDRTVELARAAGAQVYSFPWQENFAAAKNFAIEQATGDWIAFLDADEYFLPEDCLAVRALLAKADAAVDAFQFRRVDIDIDRNDAYIGASIQWRIFRRRAGLRYEGAVHEELQDAAGQRLRADFVPGLTIYHTGYSASVARQKAERNLAILLAERRRHGPQTRDAFYLADCYYGLGDYEAAARFAREAADSPLQAQGMNNRPYAVLIQSLINLDAPAEEIQEACRKAERRYPDLPEFPLMWGGYLFQNKDYREAETNLRRGLELYEAESNGSAPDLSAGEQARSFLPAALWQLGKLAAWRGDKGAALEYWTRGLRLAPYEKVLLRTAATLLKGLPGADVISFFNTIYDKRADAVYLAQTLAQTGLSDAALYYDRQAGASALSDAERFRLAGRVPAFTAAAMAEADSRCQLGIWAEEHLGIPAGQGAFAMLAPTEYRRAASGEAATVREKAVAAALAREEREL